MLYQFILPLKNTDSYLIPWKSHFFQELAFLAENRLGQTHGLFCFVKGSLPVG